MIDNTHVIILRGTGKDMIPTAEMEAFAERYGMVFRAHAVGNANRSGRVERPFHYIENNFLAGRRFADWDDFNAQAREWCDAKNRTFKRHLKAIPIELYNVERAQLQAPAGLGPRALSTAPTHRRRPRLRHRSTPIATPCPRTGSANPSRPERAEARSSSPAAGRVPHARASSRARGQMDHLA